jgi:hypothetical protein
MSVIAIQTEPHRVTRTFFDCCNARAESVDQQRIEVAIEHSIAIADPENDAQGDAVIVMLIGAAILAFGRERQLPRSGFDQYALWRSTKSFSQPEALSAVMAVRESI